MANISTMITRHGMEVLQRVGKNCICSCHYKQSRCFVDRTNASEQRSLPDPLSLQDYLDFCSEHLNRFQPGL